MDHASARKTSEIADSAARLEHAPPPSSRRPSPVFEAPEVFGRQAVANIANALPLVERAYAHIRFSILRTKLLSVMDLMLTDEGRILDVGVGSVSSPPTSANASAP